MSGTHCDSVSVSGSRKGSASGWQLARGTPVQLGWASVWGGLWEVPAASAMASTWVWVSTDAADEHLVD